MANDCTNCEHAAKFCGADPCNTYLAAPWLSFPNWAPRSGATPEPRYEQRGWLVHAPAAWGVARGQICIQWRESAATAIAAGLKVEACYVLVQDT